MNFVFILLILKFHHYTLGFKSASLKILVLLVLRWKVTTTFL